MSSVLSQLVFIGSSVFDRKRSRAMKASFNPMILEKKLNYLAGVLKTPPNHLVH